MPLQDHFHPPLSVRRHWHAFHNAWATYIAAETAALDATAYRVVDRQGRSQLDIWPEALMVGSNLPVLPLWLRGGICLPIDLNETYDRTCLEQRIAI
ncbi:MAG: hypothetical protein KME17_20730 [Cyanosarcina radialis HA8281-LM2]|jgi:hypothetical protein|nr:hypothetical protein [Cyanosarcina radialis HA8281-LM2]